MDSPVCGPLGSFHTSRTISRASQRPQCHIDIGPHRLRQHIEMLLLILDERPHRPIHSVLHHRTVSFSSLSAQGTSREVLSSNTISCLEIRARHACKSIPVDRRNAPDRGDFLRRR